ncbi:MAG: bifunctional (p)ppGpp synthetase/guanosine-3',5'-bis(diphosphate) 3'-pyrophosphohydrolase [Dehalococcoidia bacterium]
MEELLEKVRAYLPPEKVEIIQRAYDYAAKLHKGQTRKSGEAYIEHPVNAAKYLVDLSLDAPTIAAALLHDVVEDCGVSVQELRKQFGDDIARLVDGVTKLTKLDLVSNEDSQALHISGDGQAESIRKMLVAMAEDIRVVLIKLADRLHNMRTLGALAPGRRVAIAQETLDIYAPLAHRLGMGEVKWQLEDLAFRYLQPNQYRAISKLLSSKRQAREAYIRQVTDVLKRELARAGFNAEVTGRPKHIYSIYRKSQSYAAQGKQLGDIYDLFAVRVLVPTVQDCYGVLGIVHSLWRPGPGQFDDYIANPKENMYQSLHTTVRCIGGLPVEVQVRTYQMHQIAEYGVASHWRYKEGGSHKDERFEERMTWLRQLLEWQRDLTGAEEFLESVKMDIFKDQVFVYTPKNEIKELPAGSTAIDFAYSIHTELGHRCIGAKVNGKLVPLDTQLKNGDTVEVMTSKIARGPSLDWLNPHLGYIHTANARQAIRAWFRREERGPNISRGRELLRRELKRLNAEIEEIEVARMFNYDTEEDFLAAVGSGVVSMAQVAGRLSIRLEGPQQVHENGAVDLTAPTNGVTVLGVGDLLTRMAECCHPLPGNPIIGYVTRLRGVTVHRTDCPNLKHVQEQDRLVPVSWGQSRNVYPVRLKIEAMDRLGLLHDVTGATSVEHVNILSSQTDTHSDGTVTLYLTVQVASMEQLSRLFSRIEGVRAVRGVSRTTQPAQPQPSAWAAS